MFSSSLLPWPSRDSPLSSLGDEGTPIYAVYPQPSGLHSPPSTGSYAPECVEGGQPVEKVDIELIATTNRDRNAPRSAYSVLTPGPMRAPREFFNRLEDSPNLYCRMLHIPGPIGSET